MTEASGPELLAGRPQYALVAQRLIDDIRHGRYGVGQLLPAEHDLCTQFGVSRHTVREAMRLLQERGLVSRQRGIGTVVKANRFDPRYVQSTASISDLLQYVEETRLVTRESRDVIADEGLAELLRCAPGQRWLHVRGSRYAGPEAEPIALTDIYVNAAYAGNRHMIGVQKVPVYTLIEQQYGEGVVEVKQQISATLVGDDDARALKVEPGTAGLLITRHYVGSRDNVLEVAVNLHPAQRFSYSLSLRLRAASPA